MAQGLGVGPSYTAADILGANSEAFGLPPTSTIAERAHISVSASAGTSWGPATLILGMLAILVIVRVAGELAS